MLSGPCRKIHPLPDPDQSVNAEHYSGNIAGNINTSRGEGLGHRKVWKNLYWGFSCKTNGILKLAYISKKLYAGIVGDVILCAG